LKAVGHYANKIKLINEKVLFKEIENKNKSERKLKKLFNKHKICKTVKNGKVSHVLFKMLMAIINVIK